MKVASPDPVVAGTTLTYHVTVTNNGPSDAESVTLHDALDPALHDAQYCVDADGTCTPGTAWPVSNDVSLGEVPSHTTQIVTT